jgi:molybdate transport system permease protein
LSIVKNIAIGLTCILLFFVAVVVFFVPFRLFSELNFQQLFKDEIFIKSIVFGLKTSALATFFSCIFGIPAGYYLSRCGKSFIRSILDSFFDIPVVIPPLIVGVLLLSLLNSPFLKMVFTFEGAVVAQFFVSFPFTLKASKNSFELVPQVYEEIALTLGAGPVRSFYDTTLKLSMGGILSGAVLSWIRSFGEFGATLLVAGGIPGKTENVPINIYLSITEGDYLKGIAASVLVVIFSMTLIFCLKAFSKKQFKT